MERITEWRGEHAAVVNNHVNYIDQLARYEDTGLTPAEVKDMAENIETRMLTWFEAKYGYSIGELMSILEAMQEKRHAILPCKIDDPIYVIRAEKRTRKAVTYRVVELHIDHFTVGGAGIPMITACDEDNEWYELIDGTQVGQEYWLSREAAEAAAAGEPTG